MAVSNVKALLWTLLTIMVFSLGIMNNKSDHVFYLRVKQILYLSCIDFFICIS